MMKELPSEMDVLDVRTEALDDIPLLLGIIKEMGIQELIDSTVKPDGHWQGISMGTAVSIWLCYLLTTQDHRLVAVRDWAKAHREVFNQVLGIQLRETDCSDDRLANILSHVGSAATQQQLDEALLGRRYAWMEPRWGCITNGLKEPTPS